MGARSQQMQSMEYDAECTRMSFPALRRRVSPPHHFTRVHAKYSVRRYSIPARHCTVALNTDQEPPQRLNHTSAILKVACFYKCLRSWTADYKAFPSYSTCVFFDIYY